ncbi:MAG TPA: phosphatidylglycerophosphatase A [Polyangiaceae bacterium]|nr:phosphatidylglycerophosphatase A [Polyangiaceae bacterium]
MHATDRPTWVALAATVGPAGRSPIGPGTMGALAAIPLGIAVDLLAWPLRILLVSALIWLSLWVTRLYLAGETRHDPQEIVIDELAGCTVALAFAPLAPLWFAVAFVLFRAFDIIKPWPINLLEKHEGAFGVVADDIAAGLLSGVITLLLSSFFG